MSLNNYEIITCLMTLVIFVIPCFKTLRPLAPTLMTSAGIVGTFLGITCGLWSFDVNDIDSSIPLLLEGLKTSFITSLVGLIGSTLFKIVQTMTQQHTTAMVIGSSPCGMNFIKNSINSKLNKTLP